MQLIGRIVLDMLSEVATTLEAEGSDLWGLYELQRLPETFIGSPSPSNVGADNSLTVLGTADDTSDPLGTPRRSAGLAVPFAASSRGRVQALARALSNPLVEPEEVASSEAATFSASS